MADSPVKKLWHFAEHPLALAGAALVLALIGTKGAFVAAWVLFSVAVFRTKFFEVYSKPTRVVGNAVLSIGLAVVLSLVYLHQFSQARFATVASYVTPLVLIASWRWLFIGFLLGFALFSALGIRQRRLQVNGASAADPDRLAPNIVYLQENYSTWMAHIDDEGFLVEGLLDRDLPYENRAWTAEETKRTRVAVVVQYENLPLDDRRVGSIEKVSARITYDNGLAPPLPHRTQISRGAWLTSKKQAVDFGVTEKHALVLASLGQTLKDSQAVAARTVERYPNGDRGYILSSETYNVEVKLIADGVVIATFRHKLILTKGAETVEPVAS